MPYDIRVDPAAIDIAAADLEVPTASTDDRRLQVTVAIPMQNTTITVTTIAKTTKENKIMELGPQATYQVNKAYVTNS